MLGIQVSTEVLLEQRSQRGLPLAGHAVEADAVVGVSQGSAVRGRQKRERQLVRCEVDESQAGANGRDQGLALRRNGKPEPMQGFGGARRMVMGIVSGSSTGPIGPVTPIRGR